MTPREQIEATHDGGIIGCNHAGGHCGVWVKVSSVIAALSEPLWAAEREVEELRQGMHAYTEHASRWKRERDEARAVIAEAQREAALWPGSDTEAQAGAALQRVTIALSRVDTPTETETTHE